MKTYGEPGLFPYMMRDLLNKCFCTRLGNEFSSYFTFLEVCFLMTSCLSTNPYLRDFWILNQN